jgi:SAM-dependent methyltransferase
MLEQVRRRGIAAPVVEGDLRTIPFTDHAFDTVVCGLALAHVAHLQTVSAEMARVLAPRGRLIISVLHPMQAFLGWQAPFQDAAGHRRFVREHPHTHSDYLSSFYGAGLDLVTCVEPGLTRRELQLRRRVWPFIPDAALAAYQGMPAVLVLEFGKR